jgi:signal peptidase
MSKVIKKILNILVDIVIILVLVVSITVVVMSLTSRSTGVPNIFGYSPLSVQSDSMSPTFENGDLLISHVVDNEYAQIEVGDVITFPMEINGENVLNTHRVIEVVEDSGVKYYKTQGDNKETNPVPDGELKTDASVRAVWTGVKIPYIGGAISFLRTQLGFFLCVLLPMILFFVYEAIRVIVNIIAYNKEKAAEEAKAAVINSELTEEQKQRAIEEYLTKKKAEENESAVQTPAGDETSEAE